MKCIAIDDEPIALSIISRYCSLYGGIELETYTSPVQGFQRIKEWMPDVVFLDIELGGSSGLQLASHLPATCQVIFTTAYANYALDGFNLNALDFLHKPIFYERFRRAMQKAERWLNIKGRLQAADANRRAIMLKSNYKNVPVNTDDIIYIESIGNYVKVHLADGSHLMSKVTLCNILGLLPQSEFIRIHRSFVVAARRIHKFSGTKVYIGEKDLPIGKTYAETVINRLREKASQNG